MIRLAVPEDEGFLFRLMRENFPYVCRDREFVRKRMEKGIILVEEGKGFVDFEVREKVLVIMAVAVDEKHRGKGIGTRLLRAAEEIGRKVGCEGAVLFVREGNPAREFYRRNGYEFLGYSGDRVDGERVEVWGKVILPP